MSKAKDKATVSDSKALKLNVSPGQTELKVRADAAVLPAFNAALVVDAFQRNILGDELNFMALMESLQDSTDKAKVGDLSGLEAMLICQATALQTIFTSLARRAVTQEYLKHYETYLGLALKAQAQSRATISALVDLKFPRQVAYVKQANIAHGPQQVNNGTPGELSAHAREIKTQQNELLEDQSHGSTQLDTGTTTAAKRSDPEMEAVEPVHRAKKRAR